MINRSKMRTGNSNIKLLLILAGLGLLCMLAAMRAGFDIPWFGKFTVQTPPTGEPIRITLKAKLQPAGWLKQISETIKIEFNHARFPDRVGTVTLRINQDSPEAESTITLPCAAGYDYEIHSTSDLLFDGAHYVAVGNSKGTLHFKGGEVLLSAIDHAGIEEFFKRHPAQRIGTPSYRPYFDVSEQKK